ncbi:uncharacterized protein DS421_19g646120 [Arachis hypogaea]|uniref:Uncharacterized protein n=1 Tax=Arachis hypogaea TaxID=3818 RepID=A0A6B9V8H1_ARAHY|nr:uncharacterized protein DS421_19g646120 [Arachis hypogaea]
MPCIMGISTARPTDLVGVVPDPKPVEENWESDEEAAPKKTKSKRGWGRGRLSEATLSSKKRGAINILMGDKPKQVQKSNSTISIKSKPLKRSSQSRVGPQSHSKQGVDTSGVEAEVTRPSLKTHEKEVTSPEPQLPPGPDLSILERVNIVFECLNHPLEEINNNVDLKAQLLAAIDFLNKKISVTALAALEAFMEEIYNHLSRIDSVEKYFNTTVEVLAIHDK